MRFQQFDERYIVRIEQGELVIDGLTDLLRREGIEFASLSAAGAVQWVNLGYWNADSRTYSYRDVYEQMEVVSFLGNASLNDDGPMLHIHGVFSRKDFTVLGGHVKEARAFPTLEVWLRTEEIPVRRVRDAASGLELLDLPERLGPVGR
jgi:predicted DNA-binding protein with PD1-like motif